MNKRVVLPMAVLMMVSAAGLSFAQPTTAEQPAHGKMATLGTVEMSKTARMHHLAGEVVAVDQTAKIVTIKYMMRGKPKVATFTVEDRAAASLVNLQPNDQVKLSYHKEQGRLIAQSIVETYHKASK